MLLTEARRPARTGQAGELVPLAEQAAIAALHDEASTAADTDWPQILALYDILERLTGNPMVRLNRAVPVAMVHGPAAGLDLLTTQETTLTGSYRLDAVRGHLHEMLGARAEAIACYESAARGTASLPERNYLIARAARCHAGTHADPL